MNNLPPRNHNAFTIVELMVVVAIIAVLVGLLLPAVSQAREAARRMSCQSQLKQIPLCMQSYHTVKRRFPAGSRTTSGLAWGFSFQLLPYMEETSVFEAVNVDTSDCGQLIRSLQESSKNSPTSMPINLLVCPSDPQSGLPLQSGPDGPLPNSADVGLVFPGSYLGVSGSKRPAEWCSAMGSEDGNGVLYTNSKVRMREIRDGASKTLMIGERGIPEDLGWGWPICGGTECEHYLSTFHSTSDPAGQALNTFWSWHPNGTQFAFVDGHTEFLPTDTSVTTLRQLASRDGKELP